jgi:hypothetical protein
MKRELILLLLLIGIAFASDLYHQLRDLNRRVLRDENGLEDVLVAKAKKAAAEGLTMTTIEVPPDAIESFVERMREKHPGILFRMVDLWNSKTVEMYWK